MLQYPWVDVGLVGVMAIGILGTLYHRVKLQYGIGDRSIQFVGLCLVVPTVLMLGSEDKISKENMGTILGAIIGYTLSGIGGREGKVRATGQSSADRQEKER
jgi:FtsH-binding integral membrane protein